MQSTRGAEPIGALPRLSWGGASERRTVTGSRHDSAILTQPGTACGQDRL